MGDGMDPFAAQSEGVRRRWRIRTAASVSDSLRRVFSRYQTALVVGGGPCLQRLHVCSINDLTEPATVVLVASYPHVPRGTAETLIRALQTREHTRSIIERMDDKPEPPLVVALRVDSRQRSEYRLLPIRLVQIGASADLLLQWSRRPLGERTPMTVRREEGWVFEHRVARALRTAEVGHLLVFPITDARLAERGPGAPEVLCGVAYVELPGGDPAFLAASLGAVPVQDQLRDLYANLAEMWPALLCYEMVTQDRSAPSWARYTDVFDSRLIAKARAAATALEHSRSPSLKNVGKILHHTCAPRHERRRIGIRSMRSLVLQAISGLSDGQALGTPAVDRYSRCFAEHEERLFLIPAHRDHFVHQFQVYLLGLAFLTNPDIAAWFRRRLGRCYKLLMSRMKWAGSARQGWTYSPLDLHRCWFVAAIMHDIASPLEKIGDLPKELAKEFLSIPDLERSPRPYPGISWHENRGSTAALRAAEKKDPIRRTSLPRLWSRAAPICSLLHILSLYHALAGHGRTPYESDEGHTWLTAESSVGAKLLGLVEGDSDHAALGAVLAMQAGVSALSEGVRVDRSRPNTDLLRIYLPAAHAILLHDVDSASALGKARGAKKAEQYLVFDDNPLAGLLAYADLVQNWGRPRDHYRSSDFLLRTAVNDMKGRMTEGILDIEVRLEYHFPRGAEFRREFTETREEIKKLYADYRSAWRTHGSVVVRHKGVTGDHERRWHPVRLHHPQEGETGQ